MLSMNNQKSNESYEWNGWKEMYEDILKGAGAFIANDCEIAYDEILPEIVSYLCVNSPLYEDSEKVRTLADWYKLSDIPMKTEEPCELEGEELTWMEKKAIAEDIVDDMLDELREEPFLNMLEKGKFIGLFTKAYRGEDKCILRLKNLICEEIQEFLVDMEGEWKTQYFSRICSENQIGIQVMEWDDAQVSMELSIGEERQVTYTYENMEHYYECAAENLWEEIFEDNDRDTIVHLGFSAELLNLLLAKGILYEDNLIDDGERISFSLDMWAPQEVGTEFSLYDACRRFRRAKAEDWKLLDDWMEEE